MASIDQQFVEYIVKTLVSNPDDVKIDRSIDEKGVLLNLEVNPEDVGRIIGRRGATAQSIRTLLRALGTKNDARYNLKIVNNDDYQPKADEAKAEAAPVEKPDDTTEAETENVEKSTDDYAQKTREELAELDDLDI